MPLDVSKFEQQSELWSEAVLYANGRDLIWTGLHEYFKDVSFKEDADYRLNYFRWYAYLTWRRLFNISNEEFIHIAIERQVVMAHLLGFNIMKGLVEYITLRLPVENERAKFASEVKNAFINSQAYVGTSGNKRYTLALLVERIKSMKDRKLTTLEKAESIAELQNILYPNDPQFKKYILHDPVEGIDSFIELVEMFVDFDPKETEEFLGAYDAFIDAEIAQSAEEAKNRPIITNTTKQPVVSYKNDFESNAEFMEKARNEREKQKREEEKMKAPQAVAVAAPKPAAPTKVAEIKIEPKLVAPVKAPEPIKGVPAPKVVAPAKVDPPKPVAPVVETKKIEPVKVSQPPKVEPPKKPEIKIENKPEPVKAPAPKEDPMFFKKNPTPPPKGDSIPAPKALQNPPEPKKVEEPKKPEAPVKKLSYAEIKKQVENRYPKDPSGEFVNVMDVLNELQRLAGESGDEKVRDLYYFNEQSGQFEWHDTTPTA